MFAKLEAFITILCAFMSVFRVFIRYEIVGKCANRYDGLQLENCQNFVCEISFKNSLTIHKPIDLSNGR